MARVLLVAYQLGTLTLPLLFALQTAATVRIHCLLITLLKPYALAIPVDRTAPHLRYSPPIRYLPPPPPPLPMHVSLQPNPPTHQQERPGQAAMVAVLSNRMQPAGRL